MPKESVSFKRHVRMALPALISAATMYVIFDRLDAATTLHALGSAQIHLISLAMILSIFTNIIFSSFPLRNLLETRGYFLTRIESSLINAITIPLFTIMPFKSGHLAKAYYLKRYWHVPSKVSAESILSSQLLGIVSMAAIMLTAYVCRIGNHFSLEIVMLFSLLIVILIILIIFPPNTLKIKPEHLEKTALKYIASGKSYPSLGSLMMPFLLTIGYKSLMVLNYWLIFRSVGVSVPIIDFTYLIALVVFISQIPPTISGVGAREALILFLFQAYGTPETMLSAGILISLIDYIFPASIGIFFFAFSGRVILKCCPKNGTMSTSATRP